MRLELLVVVVVWVASRVSIRGHAVGVVDTCTEAVKTCGSFAGRC